MKYFVYTIIGIVTTAIVAGFFIIGSPQEERLRRFDEQRINDLQYLQSQIVFYWQNKKKLPENLEILRDDLRGVTVPSDPQTGESYGYEIRGPLTFALCATFSRPSLGRKVDTAEKSTSYRESKPIRATPSPPEPYYGIRGSTSWEYNAGRTCFERNIDTDFFKP